MRLMLLLLTGLVTGNANADLLCGERHPNPEVDRVRDQWLIEGLVDGGDSATIVQHVGKPYEWRRPASVTWTDSKVEVVTDDYDADKLQTDTQFKLRKL